MIPAYAPKVVRAAEADTVSRAANEGDPDRLMRIAARAVADAVEEHRRREPPTGGIEVCAIAGGGDNGGDALYAAAFLAEDGVRASALAVGSQIHEGAAAACKKAGVAILRAPLSSPNADDPADWLSQGEAAQALTAPVWIDGVLGTGLAGAVRDPLAAIIRALADIDVQHGPFIVAVDCPSGLNDEDGEARLPHLRADHTITMGALKTPLVLPPAAYHSTRVSVCDLDIDLPDTRVHVVESADVPRVVRAPGWADHKYTRGVAGLVVGSDTYPGAGILASMGANGAGCGMIRLDAPRRVCDLALARVPGIVAVGGRIQAGLIGPGMDDETRASARELAGFCIAQSLPLVVDAGGLDLVAPMAADGLAETTVLTPHAGEAARMLSALGDTHPRWRVEERPVAAAHELAQSTGATVLLKGARTLIVSPDGSIIVSHQGSGWSAVAGSGDVLAGVLVALSATWQARREQRIEVVPFAELIGVGAWIHAEAGMAAARGLGPAGGPISADQIALAIPGVIGRALDGRA